MDPISWPGRIAGFTTTGCLLVAGLAYTVAAGVVVMCVDGCRIDPSLAGLSLFVSVPVLLVGIGGVRSVAGRPQHPDGSSDWTWGLGILFMVGVAAAATRIPGFTCPPGLRLDDNFPLCFDAAGHRTAAVSWLWAQRVLMLVGVVLGLTVMRSVRAVVVTAPIAALAWAFGMGWLLADTLGHGLSH